MSHFLYKIKIFTFRFSYIQPQLSKKNNTYFTNSNIRSDVENSDWFPRDRVSLTEHDRSKD